MRTSVGLLAFASFVVAAGSASAQDVDWRKSYFEARDHGQKVKKPLAVIVGSGPNGFNQLIQDGSLTSDVRKIIANEYIPVYLDSEKAENRRLIQDLGITLGKGVVLSCRAGDKQAFFHDGSLSDRELTRQLWHFADPSVVVNTTTTSTSGRISYYPPSPSFAPTGSFGVYGGYGGGPAPAMRSANC
jgi:hypothetical protein